MNMKHKKAKTSEDLVKHFQKRCIERIGIILNQRKLKDLMINHKMRCIDKLSNTRTMFHLKKEDWNSSDMLQKDVVVIYDKPRHSFVTTYSYEDWVNNHWSKNH